MLLAACGNSPPQDVTAAPETVIAANYYVGNDDIYAILVSGSGGSWTFDQVIKSDLQPDKGYLVRLNDLAPAFDIRIADCVIQTYSSDHKCDPVHPFRKKDVSVINRIISGGLAAGTAGGVTNVSRTYKTSFDETAFNQAVDEALVNSGLDAERQELLSALENYSKILTDSRSELNQLKRELDADYRDTGGVQLDIQPTVTGLTEYYTNDLNFRDIVELVPLSDDVAGGGRLQESKLLPCAVRQCLKNALNAIASVRAEVDSSRGQLSSRTSVGKFVYEIRCDKTTHAGYLFHLQCPNEVTRDPAGPVPMPVSVNILARDFDGLYPNVDLDDENLKIEIGDDEIVFRNMTTNYLSVTAGTVYYNSQVQTTTAEINVAPGAIVKRSIGEFVSPAIEIESSYRQMTTDKAKSASFQFGFAAKYRVAGDAVEKTIYAQQTYNVGCVIENRIQPGSCNESPAEGTHARRQPSTVPH
jgi:hypothetical protein